MYLGVYLFFYDIVLVDEDMIELNNAKLNFWRNTLEA